MSDDVAEDGYGQGDGNEVLGKSWAVLAAMAMSSCWL